MQARSGTAGRRSTQGGSGGRKEEDLSGGAHRSVREREGERVGVDWAGGMGLLGREEKKRGEGEMWAGLGREKKEVFFFLTQTSFEQNSFENKLNLNFGCYKCPPEWPPALIV